MISAFCYFCLFVLMQEWHGSTGPLTVSDVRATSLSEAFVIAGQDLGFKNIDINSNLQEGAIIVLVYNVLKPHNISFLESNHAFNLNLTLVLF